MDSSLDEPSLEMGLHSNWVSLGLMTRASEMNNTGLFWACNGLGPADMEHPR